MKPAGRPPLEWIVFLCGTATMILELVGSRILAPFLGTSVFVWTSLIGIILGCLSAGYWQGGRLSDKGANFRVLSAIIFSSAISVALISLVNEWVLEFLQTLIKDVRLGAVAASLILFGIPSFLLGMVSPYAVRLKLTGLDQSGAAIGTLYALSTLGSIAGTFLAGFVLISYFGNTLILLFLSALLVFASILAFSQSKIKLVTGILFILGALISEPVGAAVRGPDFVDVNTAYNRVWIYPTTSEGKPIRMMRLNNQNSSAMYLADDELVFGYNRFYRLAKHFKPDIRKALMLGGAGYSYPRDFLKNFPQATMDVVEIDPRLTELARKYFRLEENPRLRIFHQDGRVFLNQTQERYDVFLGDAFQSFYSLPFQLTTVEAVRKIANVLSDDGVAMINIISALEGKRSKFLKAEFRTFKEVFPQVYVFAVYDPRALKAVQNIMLVALKTKETPTFISKDQELNGYLQHYQEETVSEEVPILKDDFAPVDKYVMKLIPRRTKMIHPLIRERANGKRD